MQWNTVHCAELRSARKICADFLSWNKNKRVLFQQNFWRLFVKGKLSAEIYVFNVFAEWKKSATKDQLTVNYIDIITLLMYRNINLKMGWKIIIIKNILWFRVSKAWEHFKKFMEKWIKNGFILVKKNPLKFMHILNLQKVCQYAYYEKMVYISKNYNNMNNLLIPFIYRFCENVYIKYAGTENFYSKCIII